MAEGGGGPGEAEEGDAGEDGADGEGEEGGGVYTSGGEGEEGCKRLSEVALGVLAEAASEVGFRGMILGVQSHSTTKPYEVVLHAIA